jgi:hypothetical protein
VTRHCTQQRLGLTRQALQVTADRALRLRAEYEARYAALRRTLLKWHAACAVRLLTATGTVGSTSCLLTR